MRMRCHSLSQLYEVYESRTCIYLVLELCQGGELFGRLKRVKRFSEAHARRLAKMMFSAVAYCHSKGIAHRDLK